MRLSCVIPGASALLLLPAVARAQQPPPAAAAPAVRPRYDVEFEAGRVEVDTDLQKLELERDVVVRADRYRLTSDRLRLYRGPRGIVVDGEGRVAFCPCPDPPISIGFKSATVAPPTDLLIEQPTLRIGDVPVLWLPYLWLRSPDRLGLLPPRVAWRGEDGLLLGAGVHAPFGDRPPDGERPMLDLFASGYVQGGAEIEARLATARSSTRMRWDHLGESLIAADAHGSAILPDSSAGAAWRVDAIRGARGRTGTLELEPAARRFDRAQLTVAYARAGPVFGMGLRGTAPRGGPLDEPGAVGPLLHVGIGSGVGEVGRADTELVTHTSSDPDRGTLSVVSQRGELGLDARPGPFAGSLEVGERIDGAGTETGDGGMARVGARAALGLPLARAFGGDPDPVSHRVEPLLEAGVLVTRERDAPAALEPIADDELVNAGVALRNQLGSFTKRWGAELDLRGGFSGSTEGLEPLLAARAGAVAEPIALSTEAAWLPSQERALATTARLRLGRADSIHVGGRAEGRLELEPTAARWSLADGWDVRDVGWFDRPGWSVGGELGVPFTDWLASAGALDYDLTADELLAVRGSIGYRHRCGCLAALAWAGHRLGREGVDAWLTVDLVP
jgi:hypothetical protein